MKWFGHPWQASCCSTEEQTHTPEGSPCRHCKQAIAATHQGFMVPTFHAGEYVGDLIYHRMCFLDHLGGLN